MQYNSYQNPYMYSNPPFYRILPISNIEEANRQPVDFNGAPTYFHNQTTNEIYVKQFDVKTGLSDLQVFTRKLADEKPLVNPYAEDFNTINSKLDALVSMINSAEEAEKKRK